MHEIASTFNLNLSRVFNVMQNKEAGDRININIENADNR